MLKAVTLWRAACLLLPCCASGQNDEVCLTVQRQRTTDNLSHGSLETHQGRPGKAGPMGLPGQKGEPGQVGPRGQCSCNQEMESLERKLQSYRVPACGAGFRNGFISDDQLTASTIYSSNFVASNGRLDNFPLGQNFGCWIPSRSFRGTAGQWLQVDFRHPIKVFGVVTQGRGNHDQWVTKFSIQYGNTTSNLITIPGGSDSFVGNNDANSYKINDFEPPVIARYFRLVAQEMHVSISLRMEYLIC